MNDGQSEIVFRPAAELLQPRSVAIVGASERAKWPTQIYNHLHTLGYAGKIFAVNPKIAKVWDIRCYPDLASLPEPPHHAIVIVPAPAVQDVLEVGVAAGLKSATVYASRIGEGRDPEILARGRALEALVEESGLALCGPNCMGVNSIRERYFGYPNAQLCKLEPGSVALVSQSGGTVSYLASTAVQRGVRFNYLVSSGNELGLDLADYVNYFVEDEHTRIIALFAEGVRRPQAFMAAAAKALKARKPIILIKTGRSKRSREAVQLHSGAISGDDDIFSAMCERYGIVKCTALDDMVETLLTFQNGRLPKGPRVAWITNSGGTVDLLCDYIEEIKGLAAPEFSPELKAELRPSISPELALNNPLDASDPPDDVGSAAMLSKVAADSGFDIVAWAATNYRGEKRDPSPLRSFFESTDKPVIAFSRMNYVMDRSAVVFQEEVGFPFLQGLPATVRAITELAFYGARAGRLIEPLPRAKEAAIPLHGSDLEKALATAGVAFPKSATAKSPAEAAAVAAHIGFPVALKIVSADISHKTEVGGVRLHLRTAADVEREAHALEESIRTKEPCARIDGFLVQEMISDGVEVLLGARTDASFGPILVIGLGGVLVELIKDVSFRLLPVRPADVLAMIGELKLADLLAGFRGREAVDIDALVKAVCDFGQFYLDHRNIFLGIEINPLIVRAKGRGVCAVDLRVVTAPGT
jgi:acetyltransferase